MLLEMLPMKLLLAKVRYFTGSRKIFSGIGLMKLLLLMKRTSMMLNPNSWLGTIPWNRLKRRSKKVMFLMSRTVIGKLPVKRLLLTSSS